MKQARGIYEAEFEGWDDFVGQVLEWLGDTRAALAKVHSDGLGKGSAKMAVGTVCNTGLVETVCWTG